MELFLENFVTGKSYAVKVKSLKEARDLFCIDRDENCVGSSDYMKLKTGDVVKDNKVIANISYNGRVWAKHMSDIEIKVD